MSTRKTSRRSKKPATRNGTVIAVGNQKGGVGKTTVTVNLAAALGEAGYSVLVIDLDPSAGSTHHLGIDPFAYEGTVELLTDQAEADAIAITDDMPDNVALIPARSELAAITGQNAARLDRAVKSARSDYDFILLDTPPNPGSPTTFAAYAVADWFLCVVLPHALAIHGLSEALRDIATMRQGPNPRLELLGTIFNAVDTRSLAVQHAKGFLGKYGNLRPFTRSPFIPSSVSLNRAAEQGKTLFQLMEYRYKPITFCFEHIAAEVVERCDDREAFLAADKVKPKKKLRRSA